MPKLTVAFRNNLSKNYSGRCLQVRLKKTVCSKKMLTEESSVSKTYITSVQNNKFQEITITPAECRKSVKAFSKIKKSNKKA